MIYAFGEYELDEQLYELRHAGEPLNIGPKAFDVLAYLITHRDRVVNKNELKAKLWSGQFVTDDAVVRCVVEARKALQDDGIQQRLIKTLRGRGYQFIAPTNNVPQRSRPSEPETDMLPDHRQVDVLVGRQREIKALQVSLADALAGHGRLVLLAGEPGIGKTRLAEALIAYASQHNVQALVGRCYEGEGAPAFWPWIQIVRSCIRTCEPDALMRMMGSGAADIAAVVPEVRQYQPDLAPPSVLEPKQAQFRFFDSLTTFLKSLATEQPLLLILDDLHWADTSSLLLLQFLAREIQNARILVVATHSALALERHHPFAHTLGELARTGISQRLTLRGLSEQDVARFIESTTRQPPPPALAALVYRKSEGNPFFIKEIVRLLDSEGYLQSPTEATRLEPIIPQEVREVIDRRLAFLSPTCVHVLSIAAVIGREFGLDVLEPLSNLAGDPLLTLLEQAVTAHLIEEVLSMPGRYRFTHVLIHDTLYSGLMAARRVHIHGQIGIILERLHRARPESHLDELAYHFCEAAMGDVDEIVQKAIDYAMQAGKQAITMLAHEEAVAHYERALQVLERRQPIDDRQRGELLLALGMAQMCSGDITQARATFHNAADLGKRLGVPELQTLAALEFSRGTLGAGVLSGAVDISHITLLEEALSALGEVDSAFRSRVMSRLAVALFYADGGERAATLSRQALNIATRLNDTAAQLDALNSRHWALYGPDRLQEQLTVATTMVQLAEQVENAEMALMGHRWSLIDQLALGDISAVNDEIEAYAHLADRLRLPQHQTLAVLFRAMTALLAGCFEEGERLTRQACVMGQRVQPQLATQAFRVQMFFLRRQQGRLQELEDDVKKSVVEYPKLPGWWCSLALLYSETGRLDEARDILDDLAADDFAALPRNGYWLNSMTQLAEVCAGLGDTYRAATLYKLLRPYAGHNATVGAVIYYTAVSHTLGLLAATRHRWQHAVEHFEAALAMHTRMGARPLVARTQLAYATMLLTRRQPGGDRQQALTLLKPALETARTLGMPAVYEGAETLHHHATGKRARAT